MNKKNFLTPENLPIIENVLNTINQGLSILDAEQRFVFINKYALDHNGRSKSDFIGYTLKELQVKGFFKNPVATRVFETLQPASAIQQSISTDGKIQNFLVHAYPLFNATGDLTYVIADRVAVTEFNDEYDQVKSLLSNSPSTYYVASPKKEKQEMIYADPLMAQLVCNALKIADLQSSVLLLGESGTGKDVMAHFIHDHSHTYNKNFVAINCASMPESLLESELFGYEKGAFTGAKTTGKIGLIESAHKGTLFLDEINSMPLSLQAKLLRVLESRTITRIGSVKPIDVDFRLIAATNESLEDCVARKTFRADLYYRLNVIPMTIPPLRERRKDIRPQIDYFLQKYCNKYGYQKQLSNEVYRKLERAEWPGNTRELRNFIERLVIMTDASTVKIKDIPWRIETPTTMTASAEREDDIREDDYLNEKARIKHALKLNKGHRQNTADYLGISRRTLQYKLKKYNLL